MYRLIVILLALSLFAACRGYETPRSSARPAPGERSPSYQDEIDAWRAQRRVRLQADDGWLTLAGLFWLKEGENRVGSGENNEVVLPKGKSPELVGTLRRKGKQVRFEPVAGAAVLADGKPATAMSLRSDADGEPTTLRIGPVSFYVISRGDRLGVRVKDSESEARKSFSGIDSFLADPKWRIEAVFTPYQPPKAIPITNIIGIVEPMQSPGSLTFSVDGRELVLDPVIETGSDELFLIFKDTTSGKSTYGAGRYLYASMPKDGGKVVVDFNKAYNPPCAFTPFATCPLPPPQNRIPVAIEAGERDYSKGHS